MRRPLLSKAVDALDALAKAQFDDALAKMHLDVGPDLEQAEKHAALCVLDLISADRAGGLFWVRSLLSVVPLESLLRAWRQVLERTGD